MIDEAGNFDMEHYSNPFYCLTLEFHDQDIDISSDIVLFNSILESIGFQPERAVHASPLIRKEFPYQEIDQKGIPLSGNREEGKEEAVLQYDSICQPFAYKVQDILL